MHPPPAAPLSALISSLTSGAASAYAAAELPDLDPAIVNPDGLKNQVEGAVVQGIGGALFEAVEFAGGKILNPRFSRYRVPRFSDVPRLETILLDRKDLPSAGAGECPIVALAPSVSNAIFDVAGVRLRSMPLAPNGLQS